MRFTIPSIAATTVLLTLTGLQTAFAGTVAPSVPTYSARDTTKAFVGLNLLFGAGQTTPEGVIGVLHGRTNTDNKFHGAKLSFHAEFKNGGGGRRAIKLTGVAGGTDVQGELGFGFDFQHGSPFGTIGAMAGYFGLGTDVDFNGSFLGYVGVHTIGPLNERTTTFMTPPS